MIKSIMMKKENKPLLNKDFFSTLFLCSLFAVTLFFQGCNSYTNNDDYLENAVDIKLLSEAKSLTKTTSEAARTASVIPPENIFYTVEAYLVDENGIKIANTDSVFETEPFEGVKLTYRLLLSTGNWRFKITGYKDKERTIPILYGESTKNTICNGGRYYETINVYFTKTNSGSANLEIDVSKVTINKLKVSGTDSALDDTYERPENSDKIIISKENVTSGSYEAQLDFYYNTALLWSTKEIINIRDNMETTNWIYSGQSEYLVPVENSEYTLANFVLTPQLIIRDKNTYCYVQSQDTQNNLTASVAPSDENSGSFIAPFKTLQAAFDRTYALNKEFAAAEKTERDFTIYINGKIDSNVLDSQTNEKLATITTDEPFNLSILPSSSATSKTINGNISIGNNITTTIKNISLDGLSSESELTINSCTFSGKGAVNINNTTANINNTKIGSQSGETTTSNAINFTNSTISIENSKDESLYATDFRIDNCNFVLKTPSSNDTIPIKTSSFTLNNCQTPSLSYANISTDNDFTISECKGFSFTNITVVADKNIEIKNNVIEGELENSFKNCKFTAENENIDNSNANFITSSISAILNITNDSNIDFSGKQSITGDSITVDNSTFALKETATITSNQIINITNSNFTTENATISSKNADLNIENSISNFNNATIITASLTVGNSEANPAPTEKTDSFTSESSTFTTTNELSFANSTVDFNKSTINGVILVEKDDLYLKDTILNGDIGRKATSEIECDGIDTASNVIFSGKTYVKKTTKLDGYVYLEEDAVLYVKNVPTVTELSQDSIETMANISALYPEKNDVVLTLLDENNEPQSFDTTFYVDESTTEQIDKRYLLQTAGYYLDYADTEDGSNLRKGIIKESSIDIDLPVVGGYNIEIVETDTLSCEQFEDLEGKYYYVMSKDDRVNTPIKAIITRFGEPIEQPVITYKLYRESTLISSVTSAATSNGFIIPDSDGRIEEELNFTDKLSYILQIIFTDNKTGFEYADSVIIVIKN